MNNDNDSYVFNTEEMTVTLQLETRTVDCTIIVILTVDEQDYIVLLPFDEDESNQAGEVWFYRYFEDENDPYSDPHIEYIDSDEELERVSAAFDEFLSSSEYDELLDDESEFLEDMDELPDNGTNTED